MATVEDVTVQIDADVSRLNKDVGNAAASVDKFEKEVRTAEQSLTKFEKVAASSSTKVGGMGRSADVAKGSFKAMRGATSQLSFQLQDVAVQAQMGTNAFTILAQQGPQIASIFGPGGAVLGAIIGVGAALSGVLFTAMKDVEVATGDLNDKFSDLVDRYDELTLAQQAFVQSMSLDKIEELETRFTLLSREADNLNNRLKLNLPDEEMRTLSKELLRVQSDMDSTRQEIDGLKESTDKMSDSVKTLVENYQIEAATLGKTKREVALYKAAIEGATAEQAIAINKSFDAIEAYEAEQESIKKRTKAQEEANREADAIARKLDQQEESIRRSIERMEAQTVATEKGRAAAIRYTAAVQASKLENKELAAQLIAAAEAQASAIEAEEKRREELKITNKEIKVAQKDHKKYTDTISDGITQAIADYKDFGSAVTSVLNDIASQLIKKNISDPLAGAIGSFDFGSLFSSGPGFDLSGMDFFARGGIVNSPSVVGTSGAGNLAIAGEAGPEAVLPLARTSGGDLGVQVTGGAPMSSGSNVTVNVINQSGAEVETSESSGPSGERIINVTVLKAMKSAFANGALDRDLRTNFGVTRQGT